MLSGVLSAGVAELPQMQSIVLQDVQQDLRERADPSCAIGRLTHSRWIQFAEGLADITHREFAHWVVSPKRRP
jgi:hypothetical protein